MGDKVWIKVVAANLTKRQLDYEWIVAGEITRAREEEQIETSQKQKKRKSKRKR
jgi:ribonuclease R